MILFSSTELLKIHKNQFGFKKNTSCNHAIFVDKETVLNYTENKSGCRIASLDAEKAFDKVWKYGLFFKFSNKLHITHWVLLKKYYDSSQGTILLPDQSFMELFEISCGVKQGGILSPYLFNIFIDDLIIQCIDSNVGAIFGNINVSIIVYADDIILISPSDTHLQILLDICSSFSVKWKIKFNPTKSNIISFGRQFSIGDNFILSGQALSISDSIKYLGIELNNELDCDSVMKTKFKKVQSSIFSLSFIGLKPYGINPYLQSFIYKTFCLSQFTYGLETTFLQKSTRDYLNVCQNNLIRQIVGLSKYCLISNVLKTLKIFNFDQLYIFSKISFIKSIKLNDLAYSIFNILKNEKNIHKKSKSFKQDIKLLESFFNVTIGIVLDSPKDYINKLKNSLNEKNGIIDSINFCFNNYKNKFYRNILYNLITPDFLKEPLENIFYSILIRLESS